MSDGRDFDTSNPILRPYVAITPHGLELGGFVRQTLELPAGTPRTDYVVDRVDGDRIELRIAPEPSLDELLERVSPEALARSMAMPLELLLGPPLREFPDRPNRNGVRLRGELGQPNPEDVPIAELLERDDDDDEYICKCQPDLEDVDGTCAECRARGRKK